MCILDLNKVLVFKFQYDYIKNKYGKKSRLLFTDNDSLRKFYSKDKEVFDFVNIQLVKIL